MHGWAATDAAPARTLTGMRVDEARSHLLTRDQLTLAGLSDRGIERELGAKTLVRVRPGSYVTSDVWNPAFAERRHLIAVVATADRLGPQSDAVAVLTSAAVLHELPLWKCRLDRVHLASPRCNGQTRLGVDASARHRITVPPTDIVRIGGIRCSSLARTVADLLRHLDATRGLPVVDAALRSVAWDELRRTYDHDQAESMRSSIAERLPAGARGVRRARMVLALGDGRSASAGESVSRMLLVQLGFAPPRLQVAIPGPFGNDYFVDFGLDDANAWGEYDGTVKYTDPAMRGPGDDLTDVLLHEKQREDWIRGTTQRRYGRWGTAHLALGALRTRLASFHIHPPR